MSRPEPHLPRVLVDGEPRDQVSALDRGLQYGDGLFETMTWQSGRIRWFDRHLARLQRGGARLGLALPAEAQWLGEVQALAGGAERCVIKLILTRGVATARGYRPSGSERPTRIVSRHEWPVEPPGAELRVHLSPVPLGRNWLLAGIKHLNRLEQVLAQQAAAAAGVDEALQCTHDGAVQSGTMSNLFLCDGLTWLTPPIEECGVAGIMRSLILERAGGAGVQVRESALSVSMLQQAPAVILSNVRWGLRVVNWYEGRRLGEPEGLRRVREAIDGG